MSACIGSIVQYLVHLAPAVKQIHTRYVITNATVPICRSSVYLVSTGVTTTRDRLLGLTAIQVQCEISISQILYTALAAVAITADLCSR